MRFSDRSNYLVTVITSVGSSVLSASITLVTIPLTIQALGLSRYGIWALILSVLAYLNVSGLGIDAAATVLVSKAQSMSVKVRILRRAFFGMLVLSGIALLGVAMLSMSGDQWLAFLGKVPDEYRPETRAAFIILALGYVVALPYSLTSSYFRGTQQSFIDNIFISMGSLGPLFALGMTNFYGGNLILFASSISVFLLVTSNLKLLVAIRTFHIEGPRDLQYVSEADGGWKGLLTTAARLLGLSFAGLIIWNSDNLFISNLLGMNEVATYSVAFRLVGFTFIVFTAINNSVVPFFAREFGKGNWEWIRINYQFFISVSSSVGGGLCVAGVLLFRPVLKLLTGHDDSSTNEVFLFLGGYSFLLSMVSLNSGLINGFNYLKGTIYISLSLGIIKLSLMFLFVPVVGVYGVALSTFLSSLLTEAWMAPILLLRRSKGSIRFPFHRIFLSTAFLVIPLSLVGYFIGYTGWEWPVLTSISSIVLFVYLIGAWLLLGSDYRRRLIATVFALAKVRRVTWF